MRLASVKTTFIDIPVALCRQHAQYEPAGRAWLVSSYCALRQARRRTAKKDRRTRVLLEPGVKSEARFCLQRSSRPAGIALFPRVQFPPSDDPRHRIGWFDASTSWGMGGAFLLKRGSGFVCYFFHYQWTADEQWHVNVLEAVAGLTLLVAAACLNRSFNITRHTRVFTIVSH